MNILAVVAARGGSKGLPGKNLRAVGGVSMLGWTLRAAAGSRSLTETIVSTDDPAIAREARALGGKVPFERPAELAQDDSGIVGVLQHAVGWWERSEGKTADLVVLLQATSPLRTSEDIDETVALVRDSGCDSAQTVALDESHPWHRFRLDAQGRIAPLHPEAEGWARRQDAPGLYMPTGAVFVVRRRVLMEEGRLHGKDRRGLVRPRERSVDVDTEADLVLAEYYLSKR